MRPIMQCSAFCVIGIVIGCVSLLLMPYLPLPVNHPLFTTVGIRKPHIIGFLPYFLTSRANNNYDPSITTLTYFGITIGSDGHLVKLTNPQQEDPGWYDLQTTSVQKKLLDAIHNHETLSLTVLQQDDASISALLTNPRQSAKNLLSDVVPVLQQYGFSDLNIDIESFKETTPAKEQSFVTFLSTIKQELVRNNKTLTVDISPIDFVKQYLINPISVGKLADYSLIMAYDYNTTISANTGPIAPLGGSGVEREFDVTQTLEIATKEINPQKIILGIPLYGYEWDSLHKTPLAATIPDTGQTASNRRIMTTFTSSCTTCQSTVDPLAEETDYIFQEQSGDQYYHQSFVLDANALEKRIMVATNTHLAGVALWALGYEGDMLLQPLTAYKNSFSLQ